MVTARMDAVVHFRHAPDEVAPLEAAIRPLMPSVRVVATGYNRQSLRRILGCEFFRAREASAVRQMLLRAVKHSRATLHEIFPLMQSETLQQAQDLEDAIRAYWALFNRLREESLPVH